MRRSHCATAVTTGYLNHWNGNCLEAGPAVETIGRGNVSMVTIFEVRKGHIALNLLVK